MSQWTMCRVVDALGILSCPLQRTHWACSVVSYNGRTGHAQLSLTTDALGMLSCSSQCFFFPVVHYTWGVHYTEFLEYCMILLIDSHFLPQTTRINHGTALDPDFKAALQILKFPFLHILNWADKVSAATPL